MKHLNPIYLKDKVFFLMFSGLLFGFGMTVLLFLTWLTAYFHPSKTVLVTINKSGEANLELFMFFILIDFLIVCLVYGLKRIFNKENKNAIQ
jgi:hypothetical protein